MHPFEFAPQEVAHLVGLGVVVGDPFGAFLQIVLVVTLVDIDLAVVEFHHAIADAVEEITVVGDHEQGAAGTFQIILQILDRIGVQVVGRLVEDQEIGFRGEHLREGDTLDLAAGKIAHPLVRPQAEVGQQADDAVLVFKTTGFVEVRKEARAAAQHLVKERGIGVERVVLFQEGDADILEEEDFSARIGFVLPGQDPHQ